MTLWNLSFDGAAIFLLLLIFVWYFNEKRIPLRSHHTFLVLMAGVFAATGLEVISVLMARNMDMVGYDMVYNALALQMFVVNLVPLALSYYLLLLAHIDMKQYKLMSMLYRLCAVLDVLVIVVNARFHWGFVYENNVFRVKGAGIALYIINAVMVLISLVILVRSKQNFLFLRMIPTTVVLVCCVAAYMIQIIYQYPLYHLMLAATCLTIYHYQQNSGKVMDSVTGQFNRRFMGEFLRFKFKKQKEFGILVIAMDDFKFVNKTYGVENGDHFLYQAGQFLEQLKAPKTVFRFGSDQFCVVIDRSADGIMEIAEQIHERFHHPWYGEEQRAVMMSASICCIECPKDAENYGELVEVIDYSMSLAKKTRKGMITHANEIDLEKIKHDKAVEKAVKLAIDRDELLVHYQPIFSVTKGVYNSAEALVRLHDEELGWISPEDFIPIAEKNGLIVEMGEMILEKVCRFIRDFKLSETTVEYIEVNISPVQMIQQNFAERVKNILEKYNVTPDQINIEITETATVNYASMVSKNINSLVDYGITFSLDDYGSGNANIDYINHMPFKIIKIDKDIIWDSFKNSKAGITLEYTIGMLNALQLFIVAEGVETEEMKQQLADFGCHYMQGWYYSKAVPDTEFMQLLQVQ